MTPLERQALRKQRRLDREELRQKRRENKLAYQAARYDIGKTSPVPKILAYIFVGVMVSTIIASYVMMDKHGDLSGLDSMHTYVIAGCATCIAGLIAKNTFENTGKGITAMATQHRLEGTAEESEDAEFVSNNEEGETNG